eukprot:382448_1
MKQTGKEMSSAKGYSCKKGSGHAGAKGRHNPLLSEEYKTLYSTYLALLKEKDTLKQKVTNEQNKNIKSESENLALQDEIVGVQHDSDEWKDLFEFVTNERDELQAQHTQMKRWIEAKEKLVQEQKTLLKEYKEKIEKRSYDLNFNVKVELEQQQQKK